MLCLLPAGSEGRAWAGGVAGPVPSKRPSEVAHPDGAQPPRGSERVPRGRGHPSRPRPPLRPYATLSVDLTRADTRLFGAVRAAEDAVAVLDAVADDAAPAVLADRRDLLDGALERVVGPDGVLVADLHRPSIVVAADVTPSHGYFLLRPRAGARRAVGSPPRRWPRSRSKRLPRTCCRAEPVARPRSPTARGPRGTARVRSRSRGRSAASSRGASRGRAAACTRA